jgi:predicted Zn-dependent protease
MNPAPSRLMSSIRPCRRGAVNLTTVIALVVLIGAILLSVVVFGGATPKPAAGSSVKDRVSPAEAMETILDAVQKRVRAGQHAEAAAILEEAVRTYADQQSLRLALAESYVALNRPADAYDQYLAALSFGPRDAATEFAAGTMARMSNRPELAIEHYAAAQSADMANPIYPLYLAQVQRRANRIDEAKASLLRVVNLQPDNAIAWGTLADIALGENKLDICTQHIAKARELEPRVGTWRLIEARLLKRQSKPEQALLVLSGLSEMERHDLFNARLVAECHAMLGQPLEAANVVVAAADANAANAELALEAANWLLRANDPERARKFALRARTLGNEQAGELLAELGE